MITTMKTLDIRVKKLNQLVKQYGSQTALCEVTGLSASYLSQMLSGHRTIGEKTARSIEQKVNVAHLWMDTDDDGVSPILQEVLVEMEPLSDEDKRSVLRFVRGMKATT